MKKDEVYLYEHLTFYFGCLWPANVIVHENTQLQNDITFLCKCTFDIYKDKHEQFVDKSIQHYIFSKTRYNLKNFDYLRV